MHALLRVRSCPLRRQKSVLSSPAIPVREYQRAMAFNGDDDAPEVAHLDAPEPGGTADKVLLRFRGGPRAEDGDWPPPARPSCNTDENPDTRQHRQLARMRKDPSMTQLKLEQRAVYEDCQRSYNKNAGAKVSAGIIYENENTLRSSSTTFSYHRAAVSRHALGCRPRHPRHPHHHHHHHHHHRHRGHHAHHVHTAMRSPRWLRTLTPPRSR